jgi:uncharacterized protein
MIIIGMADIHGRLPDSNGLSEIMASADVILLVGDLTNFGGEAEADSVISAILRQSGKVFAVSGNCDFDGVDAYLSRKVINLHGSAAVFNDIGFIGLGGSLITPFGTPNEFTESELEQVLNESFHDIPENIPLVFVSHQPPIQTACDRISSGKHVGSYAVRKFIETHQPLICFTGHIHESAGMDKIGKTHIINPGQLGRGGVAYAEIIDENITVEIQWWK